MKQLRKPLAMLLAILMTSILAFHSVLAIAISFCIGYWMDAMISMIPIKRLLNYGFRQQFADLWKIVLAALIMFLVIQCVGLFQWNTLLLLIVQMLVGIVCYVGISCVLKIEAQKTLVKMVRKMVRK